MENKKRTIIITALVTAIILSGVFVATYAYFIANYQNIGANSSIIVETRTVDNLTFNRGEDITLNVNDVTLGIGAGNVSDSVTSTVVLQSRNDEASTRYYKASVLIPENTFTYTSGATPEILLTVTKNNTPIISNRDITTFSGVITIPVSTDTISIKQAITANAGATTTDTWVATITFVNLDSDQTSNVGKSLSATLYFDISPILPSLYQEVEYIETGAPINEIDTGLAVYNYPDFEIDLDFSGIRSDYGSLYGIRGIGDNMNYGARLVGPNVLGVSYNLAEPHLISFNINSTTRYQYNAKKAGNTFYNNIIGLVSQSFALETALSGDPASAVPNSLILYKYNNQIGGYKLYNCKIFINEMLERNFVPCYRKSDNEIGLYDTVHNTFYQPRSTVGSGAAVGMLKGSNVI